MLQPEDRQRAAMHWTGSIRSAGWHAKGCGTMRSSKAWLSPQKHRQGFGSWRLLGNVAPWNKVRTAGTAGTAGKRRSPATGGRPKGWGGAAVLAHEAWTASGVEGDTGPATGWSLAWARLTRPLKPGASSLCRVIRWPSRWPPDLGVRTKRRGDIRWMPLRHVLKRVDEFILALVALLFPRCPQRRRPADPENVNSSESGLDRRISLIPCRQLSSLAPCFLFSPIRDRLSRLRLES